MVYETERRRVKRAAMKEEGMEFKFSCKRFEIHFAGDPGFVEAQLSKYEPFIMEALRSAEAEAPALTVPPGPEVPAEPGVAEPLPPAGSAEDHRDRRHRDRRRRPGNGGGPQWRRNDSGPDNYSRSAAPAGEDESRRPERTTPAPAAPEPETPAREVKPEKAESYQEPLPFPDEPGSGSRPFPGPAPAAEFASRRRQPRIRDEELVRLMDEKKPRTHHDRIMVFGYYMEHEGGGSDFTLAELKRCYDSARLDPGVNLEQVINHATRSGFVVRYDEGRTERFKLSSKGRGYVEDGLKLS